MTTSSKRETTNKKPRKPINLNPPRKTAISTQRYDKSNGDLAYRVGRVIGKDAVFISVPDNPTTPGEFHEPIATRFANNYAIKIPIEDVPWLIEALQDELNRHEEKINP